MLSFNTVNGLYKSSRKSNMLSFVLLFFMKCSVANFLNETTLNTCLLNVKLQINCEIFITFSLCIHVIFESCTINSLGKIMGCQYILQLYSWKALDPQWIDRVYCSPRKFRTLNLKDWVRKGLVRYSFWYIL